jgi:hypothetical protein
MQLILWRPALQHHTIPGALLLAPALTACGAGGSPPSDDDKQLARPASRAVALNNARQRHIAAGMSISKPSH